MQEVKNKKKMYTQWWFWVIIILLILGYLISLSYKNVETPSEKQVTEVVSNNETITSEKAPESNTEPVAAEPKKKMVEITFDNKITIDDKKVVFLGETNLQDGAVLHYVVYNDSNDINQEEGKIQVKTGKFKHTVDISSYANGNITAKLTFYPSLQSEKIIEIYGPAGEYITGERVTEAFSGKIISFQESYLKSVPIALKGAGDTATDMFSLNQGYAIVKASHTGSSNFILHLLDQAGKKISLVNEIGNYDGSTFALIKNEGKHLLNVKADGPWSIEVSQSPTSEAKDAPASFTGQGDDVVFVNLKSGLTKFSSEHLGKSNFIVKVNGSSIVNEIGHYSGSSANSVQDDGLYIISIRADGKWSITVEQ